LKFTLTYEGSLPPSANKGKNKAKWAIRKHFHPQLVDLWANHPALLYVSGNRHFPTSGGMLIQGHHQHPQPALQAPFELRKNALGRQGDILDLCEDIERHGRKFRPLVRESFALHCGLEVLFLRREDPGKVYQGGDIDGRIKTLIDALAMPQHKEQVLEKPGAAPTIFCLMEDDSLVSGLHIESERLLGDGEEHPADYVKLVIEVDVRVRMATIYNQSFLG
jgi:hypothetical protein